MNKTIYRHEKVTKIENDDRYKRCNAGVSRFPASLLLTTIERNEKEAKARRRTSPREKKHDACCRSLSCSSLFYVSLFFSLAHTHTHTHARAPTNMYARSVVICPWTSPSAQVFLLITFYLGSDDISRTSERNGEEFVEIDCTIDIHLFV